MARSNPTRSKGKLVDTWYYEYEGIAPEEGESSETTDLRVRPIKVAIELRLFKKYTDVTTPPLAAKEVWFEVTCKELNKQIMGTDIEALRYAMWDFLDDQYKVKWEHYYLVSVDPRAPYEGLGSGLAFGYKDIEKGTAYDGTLLMRKSEYMRGLVITPWPGEFTDKRGKVIACIPATKANEEALENFARLVDEMRKKLSGFLKPEVIMQTLSNMSDIPLLAHASKDAQDD